MLVVDLHLQHANHAMLRKNVNIEIPKFGKIRVCDVAVVRFKNMDRCRSFEEAKIRDVETRCQFSDNQLFISHAVR